MEKQNKDLHCHPLIFFNKHLSPAEQSVLILISNSSSDGICRIKQKELSKLVNLTHGSLRTIIYNLKKKRYLRKLDKGLAVFINNEHINFGDRLTWKNKLMN